MNRYFDNKDELFMQPRVTQYGSHMVMTNVSKETKRKYVNINTRFSDEYGYSSVAAFNVSLPERVNEVKTTYINNIEIPITFYNISSILGNNVLEISYNGGQTYRIVTVTDGQYTVAGLLAAIRTAIHSIGGDYVNIDCSGSLMGPCIFSYNNAGSGSTVLVNFDITSHPSDYDLKSRLGWTLGYRTSKISIVHGKPITSPAFIDLTGPRYLFLVLDEYSNGNQTSFLSPLQNSLLGKNILGRVAMDYTHFPYGSVLVATNINGYLLSDRRSYTGKVDLQRFNVQLVDEWGRPISLNGVDFSFCLELEHE
jgi:hypothetical protein